MALQELWRSARTSSDPSNKSEEVRRPLHTPAGSLRTPPERGLPPARGLPQPVAGGIRRMRTRPSARPGRPGPAGWAVSVASGVEPPPGRAGPPARIRPQNLREPSRLFANLRRGGSRPLRKATRLRNPREDSGAPPARPGRPGRTEGRARIRRIPPATGCGSSAGAPLPAAGPFRGVSPKGFALPDGLCGRPRLGRASRRGGFAFCRERGA